RECPLIWSPSRLAMACPTGPSSSPMTTSGSAADHAGSASTSASPVRRMIRSSRRFFFFLSRFLAISAGPSEDVRSDLGAGLYSSEFGHPNSFPEVTTDVHSLGNPGIRRQGCEFDPREGAVGPVLFFVSPAEIFPGQRTDTLHDSFTHYRLRTGIHFDPEY